MRSDGTQVRLGAIAQVNPPRRIRKGQPVSFVEMAALPQHSRDIAPADIQTRTAKGSGAHFQNGDTLLARITPCLENGKTALVRGLQSGEIGEGSTEFIVLCGTDPADNDFIYYLCRHPDFRQYAISRMEGTSGRQRVSWQPIAAFEFECPAPARRREAAALLSLIDDRIDLLRQTNATLESIAQALFKSWFINFDPVRAKAEGREPDGMDAATAALFPSEFEESELGAIPKGWSVQPVGDLVEAVGGSTPDTKNEAFWAPSVHHWTSPKDLSGATAPVLLDTERKVSEAGLAKISSGLLPAGTLLMSSRAPIGYLSLAQIPVAINQGYIAMLPGGRLPPAYMYFWCKLNMDAIKGRANGSTFMEISKKAFRPIPAVLPAPELVEKFLDFASPVFNRVTSNELQARSLAALRDTLLPRLISGALRLPEAEAQIDEAIA